MYLSFFLSFFYSFFLSLPPSPPPPYLLRQGLCEPSSLGCSLSGWTASPRQSPVSTSRVWRAQVHTWELGLESVCWGPNSSPHTCMTSTLPTAPFPGCRAYSSFWFEKKSILYLKSDTFPGQCSVCGAQDSRVCSTKQLHDTWHLRRVFKEADDFQDLHTWGSFSTGVIFNIHPTVWCWMLMWSQFAWA